MGVPVGAGLSAPRRLAHLPTPLEPLDRLTADLGGQRVWIKRDDCTGLLGGGSKARKLEWLMADAMASGATVILTTGAPQSNHARQTAGAAAKMGLACELLLVHGVPMPGPSYLESGNLLLGTLTGARIRALDADTDATEAMQARAEELRAAGESPYIIPAGGSSVIGAMGYVECAFELSRQLEQQEIRIGTVVHASGSGGTQAGLAVGLATWTEPVRLLGVSVGASRTEMVGKITPIVEALQARIRTSAAPSRIEVTDHYVGRGYGIPTLAGTRAVRLLAETEGILLDPVYTGKAMAALIDLVEMNDEILPAGDVLFLHTGGWPALFGYQQTFLP